VGGFSRTSLVIREIEFRVFLTGVLRKESFAQSGCNTTRTGRILVDGGSLSVGGLLSVSKPRTSSSTWMPSPRL